MTDPSFDTAVAARWFAIQANNASWDWLYANESGQPTDPIVHVVHASYYHWSEVGTVINQARAASLVANVHSAVGNAGLALAMANQCIALTAQAGAEAQDWDVAFAQDSLARALAAAGDPGAADQRAAARRAGDDISDPDDKQVFDEWFDRGP